MSVDDVAEISVYDLHDLSVGHDLCFRGVSYCKAAVCWKFQEGASANLTPVYVQECWHALFGMLRYMANRVHACKRIFVPAFGSTDML